jgi:hypothetical protein
MNGAFPLRSVVPVQELSASMLLLHGMPEGSPHSYDQMAGVAEGEHVKAQIVNQEYWLDVYVLNRDTPVPS